LQKIMITDKIFLRVPIMIISFGFSKL